MQCVRVFGQEQNLKLSEELKLVIFHYFMSYWNNEEFAAQLVALRLQQREALI
jgi:hypothetical protein